MVKAKISRGPVTRTAIAVGGAKCVWNDLERALELFKPDAVGVCNDVGTVYEDRIDYWCTLHQEKFQQWQSLRAKNGFNTDYIAVNHELENNAVPPPRIDLRVDYRYPEINGSGSSGLYVVKTLQDEGFNRIVLVGVPMQPKQAHYFDPGKDWNDHDMFTGTWVGALDHIKDQVRSMSGWTEKLLGSPTSSWLAGGSQ